MNVRRGATETIWKTVVFAGAMLGSAAGCSSKSKPPAAPSPGPGGDASAQQADPNDPNAKKQPDPCADQDPCAEQDPCAWTDPCSGDRIRGSSDEGGEGRGFILS
jgi:hypothetical protein